MANQRIAKHKATLPNGRSSKPVTDFGSWWCKFFPKDATYPSWKALSSSAKDLLLICHAKSGRAASQGKKDSEGRPIFEFTATEAERAFSFTRPTFDAGIHRLMKLGFIERVSSGGIMCGKGIPATYRLSSRWKEWAPPERDNSNIGKARAARKKKGKSNAKN